MRFVFIILSVAFLAGCSSMPSDYNKVKPANPIDLDPGGADLVSQDEFYGASQHRSSRYYKRHDYYNMKSNDELTILPHFKTFQQTSNTSCGAASVLMVLDYYNRLDDWDEKNLEELVKLPSNGKVPGSKSLRNIIEMFKGVGRFDIYSTFDAGKNVDEVFTLKFIRETLAAGNPIIIGWNDFGGHWQVIIGYDTMGTETELDDVLIVADPYDVTDHWQDGYGIYPAIRFIYNFDFYNLFPEKELPHKTFLIAKPK
ncbi:MAG: C39 family peptidase [Rickettsiales bacterium]|jgi:hypothetical protein|nr:C39 family peptidase [Rickettsiales bacterium]